MSESREQILCNYLASEAYFLFTNKLRHLMATDQLMYNRAGFTSMNRGGQEVKGCYKERVLLLHLVHLVSLTALT